MDDIVLNKVSIIEKCINRIIEEYVGYEDKFEENYTKQDSVVLNLERACQACIDLGMHSEGIYLGIYGSRYRDKILYKKR